MAQSIDPRNALKVRRAKIILWVGLLGIILVGLVIAVYFIFLKHAGTNSNDVNIPSDACSQITNKTVCENRHDCNLIDEKCSCNTYSDKAKKCGQPIPLCEACLDSKFTRCEQLDCSSFTNTNQLASCSSITTYEACNARTDCLPVDFCSCTTTAEQQRRCGETVSSGCFCVQGGFKECQKLTCTTNTNTVNTNTSVPIANIYPGKIVYGIGMSLSMIPKLQADCQQRGGTFSECGDPCEPGAEQCITVCAYTCALPTNSNSNTNTVPADEQTCLSRGGKWGTIGLGRTEMCNLPTADGGKTCTDGSQCEAKLCPIGVWDESKINKNATVSGKCPSWRIVVGCLGFLASNGQATPGPCID